jgi:hypothetical protein
MENEIGQSINELPYTKVWHHVWFIYKMILSLSKGLTHEIR